MLIGAALLLCILSVPVLGGRLQALGELEFRRGGCAVAALVIQIVIISILRVDVWGLSEEIHLATYFLLGAFLIACLLYTSPSPRDGLLSRMPSSA